MATTERKKGERHTTAAASEIRVGVGLAPPTTNRCKATHDIPWTERCILEFWHIQMNTVDPSFDIRHEDKKGNRW